MKVFSILLLIFISFSCGASQPEEQEYIKVDARVRVYHKDGRRTFKDYQSFDTRTVDLLANYKTPKQATTLSIYGGDLSQQYQSTGFFYVKKVADRWTCVDPLGYRYINVALNGVVAKGSKGTMKALEDNYGTQEQWLKENRRWQRLRRPWVQVFAEC